MFVLRVFAYIRAEISGLRVAALSGSGFWVLHMGGQVNRHQRSPKHTDAKLDFHTQSCILQCL